MTHHYYSMLKFIAPVFFISNLFNAQQELPKKYSLFNPVPKSMMREMETDRPDVTESPYTVDAGHIQYETDLLRLRKENSELTQTRTLLINQGNIKIGITGSTAMQIGFQTYGVQKETEKSSGNISHTDGFGDINFRIKQNLIGNDKGNFVMAVLPYIKFPTSQYDHESRLEYGLIVPMLYKFAGDWNLGFQVEVDKLKDQDQPEMHTEFLQTLTISHPLTKSIDGIAETYYTYDFKAHQFSNYINAAIQMEVVKNFKVDAGLNYGLQHNAEKHYFVGFSYLH
ncbi:Putative MetA-pathway of phenol degradation [Chryseobacterium taichungense]|uniref:Putative MetA-pathway of phenol degradation n=1 Tax=Chryseobacterium taichungense TaxID=295069 RepID=A0A1H7X6S7_9FLAO|nr:transporter [Chryseobacterium taichungense]SEM28769.1 Putative MetA-pathway of phenol degradation [Chryseobacterium taichungense]